MIVTVNVSSIHYLLTQWQGLFLFYLNPIFNLSLPQKHLAKGRDLQEATSNVESLRECTNSLNQALQAFSERLELVREKIEGAARLHHLFGLQSQRDNDHNHGSRRLSEEKQWKQQTHDKSDRVKQQQQSQAMGIVQSRAAAALKVDVKRFFTSSTPERPVSVNSQPKLLVNSTPTKPSVEGADLFPNWRSPVASSSSDGDSPDTSLVTQEQYADNLARQNIFGLHSPIKGDSNEEDEEDHSKIADSGLGGCDRCEGQENVKLKHACSCQSFEDAAMMMTKNSGSDDLDEDEDDEDEGGGYMDNSSADHKPMSFQPNSHLFSHSSHLDMDFEAEVPGIDQKTQK